MAQHMGTLLCKPNDQSSIWRTNSTRYPWPLTYPTCKMCMGTCIHTRKNNKAFLKRKCYNEIHPCMITLEFLLFFKKDNTLLNTSTTSLGHKRIAQKAISSNVNHKQIWWSVGVRVHSLDEHLYDRILSETNQLNALKRFFSKQLISSCPGPPKFRWLDQNDYPYLESVLWWQSVSSWPMGTRDTR